MEPKTEGRDRLLRSVAVFLSLLVMPYYIIAARYFVAPSVGRHIGVIVSIAVAAIALLSWRVAGICLLILAGLVLSVA